MDPLAEELADFIAMDPADATDADFNRLALALFARQYERIAPYRRLCDSVGRAPENVADWREIPAVPAEAFKRFALSCAPVEQAIAVFHSSGTTGPETSRHYMDQTAVSLYELSLRRGFDLALGPDRPRTIWAVMPSPADAPHSSLSHMLGALGAQRFFWDKNEELAQGLRGLSEPIILFGTAFSLLHLLESTEERWSLPPGSLVVETGGFKGRTRVVGAANFRARLADRFGFDPADIWSEYGMSEMASQLYGLGMTSAKSGPHWLRTRLLDASTFEEVDPASQTLIAPQGLIVQYDLANWNSVLAIETQDLGIWAGSGPAIVLIGRAPGSQLRGCSLMAEELWHMT
jgi:phenylacetate-coenzyme A ligase PaaK-like adenylate-forming protein